MLHGNVALRNVPGLPVGMAAVALASVLVPVAAAADGRLHAVDTWMYQIQDLDEPGAAEALAATDYDMLVLEPGHNFGGWSYDTSGLVSRLARRPGGEPRLLLAYVDVGQAEDYRDYWQPDWVAPAGDADWGDPEAGDLRNRHFDDYTTEARLVQTDRYRAFGLPVFSVDYAIDPANVALVYREAPRHGLVPLVTRVSLSRLTTTPPPWL